MDHKHLAPCPLCGHCSTNFLLEGRDRLHGVAGTWQLHQCPECRCGFLFPMPEEKEISSFYPGNYYAYSPPSLPQPPSRPLRRVFWKHRQNRLHAHAANMGYPVSVSGIWKMLDRLLPASTALPPFQKNGKLLDVGCGSGQYLLQMKSLGWQVQGVEISREACDAASRAGLPVFCGTLEQAAFPDESFHYIRLSDVLEHVPSPRDTLHELRRILASGGRIEITMPNLDAWTFQVFGEFWFPLEIPRHLYHFTPKTIRWLANATGLKVVRIDIWSHKEVDVIPSLPWWMQAHRPHLYRLLDDRLAWKLARKAFALPKRIATLQGRGSAMTVHLTKDSSSC